MFSYKKLTASDIIVSPYVANKEWIFYSGSLPSEVLIYQGTNVSGTFNLSGSTTTNGEYQALIYNSINNLFYQQYNQSTMYLNTQSLATSLYYASASSNRATASYTIYNENPGFVNNFPTGFNETIQVLAISKNIYGSQLLENSFFISTSFYTIVDDGRGNLIDPQANVVGNIFYSHGLVVITSQDYQDIFQGGHETGDDLVDFDYANLVDYDFSDLLAN